MFNTASFCPAADQKLNISPHAVDIYDVGVVQLSEAVVLRPQVGQGRFSLGKREVVAHTLGHHVPAPILARVNRAESSVGNVLRWAYKYTRVGGKQERQH